VEAPDPVDDEAVPGDRPGQEAAPVPAVDDDLAALERLREALIASEPLVAPGLVRAGSVVELEQSFAAAKAAALHTRDLALASAAPRISTGAPGRTPPVPATAFEKIRTGLQRNN